MLAIRLQRTGRKGHAQYRMIVQDARKSPTSGKIVASLGSYNPHTKSVSIDKEKAGKFLCTGAQPSSRVVSLLAKEGVEIPDWAKKLAKKERSIKNTDKLRRNRPVDANAMAEAPAEVTAPETDEVPATEVVDASSETEEVSAVDNGEATVEETPDVAIEAPVNELAPEA